LPWNELFRLLRGIPVRDHALLEQLQALYESAPKTTAALNALCGIVQAIVDFDRMSYQEMEDILEPSLDVSQEFLRLHRGTLVSMMDEDSLLPQLSETVGGSPYVVIPHAVLLHNERVVDYAEAIIDEVSTQTQPRALSEARQEAQGLLERESLPNFFQYRRERDIFERGMVLRGEADRQQAVRKKLDELSERLKTQTDLQSAREAMYITFFLGFVSLTSVLDALSNFLSEEVKWLSPGVLVAITVSFLVVYVVLMVRFFPRSRTDGARATRPRRRGRHDGR